jgi:hypothetical protein
MTPTHLDELELDEIERQHKAWLAKEDTSPGQRADSQTILNLIAEIKYLREKAWKYDELCK